MNALAKAAGLGAAAAVVGILLLGRAPGGATVVGEARCSGRVDVVVTVDDCGGGRDGVVLGRWSGACGAFSVDVPTVGPGVGYVCGFQDGRAARWRGTDGVVLDLVEVRR